MVAARLTLASRSPQRRAILAQLGIDFRVEVPEVDEVAGGEPRELVVENARRKARAVAADPALGADTAVVLDGRVFGKPGSPAEAAEFLGALSGRSHEVHGGVCLTAGGREQTVHAVTLVRFRELDRALVDWYLASGEWRERAGAYAIQGRGAALVEGIDGDYLNVVGLPVAALISSGFVPFATGETSQAERW
jgi:septum formation protein